MAAGTPQEKAQEAAELGRQLMNARKPGKTAIQACVYQELKDVSEDVLFEAGHKKDANGIWEWPTPQAAAYTAMIEAVQKMPESSFKRASDKQKLVNFLTEKLGIEGCKQVLRKELGKNVPDSQFEVFHGPGVTNLVLVDPPPIDNPDGTVLVGEAKGGSSKPKDDQGTIKDLRKIAKKMSENEFNAKRRLPEHIVKPGDDAAARQAKDEAHARRVQEESDRRAEVGDALLLALDSADRPVTIVTVQTPVGGQPEVIKRSQTRP